MGSQKYLESIHNAFSEAKAWRYATFVVSGLCAFLGIALMIQAGHTPVVLVPAGFSQTHGPVVVEPGARSGTNPDYLAQAALADLHLILDWSPDNVTLQFRRFLNRTTSALYARENVQLLAQAQDDEKNDVSEGFYPEKVEVDVQDRKVEVYGSLIRWTGDKQVMRSEEKFTVTYVNQEGYLHVADLVLSQ
ncbi:MAG: TraE/TraK family type IV conjugative transfer system protein [Terriglobia bacterium]|nr:TraE/TraK family type IV conjugative transfer system protein [Terriglobia bacterium]